MYDVNARCSGFMSVVAGCTQISQMVSSLMRNFHNYLMSMEQSVSNTEERTEARVWTRRCWSSLRLKHVLASNSGEAGQCRKTDEKKTLLIDEEVKDFVAGRKMFFLENKLHQAHCIHRYDGHTKNIRINEQVDHFIKLLTCLSYNSDIICFHLRQPDDRGADARLTLAINLQN